MAGKDNHGVTPALDSELNLGRGTTVKNRLFKSAMSEQLADAHHNPTPELESLYRTWSAGGVGLCISGNIMVDRHHLGEPKNVVLDRHSDMDAFKRWTQAGSDNQTQFWAQLNHPGKQSPSFINSRPVAPSEIPLEGDLQKNFKTPRELSESEIFGVIEQFSECAGMAKAVGFNGVQIHGAHGYLVNQFLSPRHNQRTDQWGGSLENRMRFLLHLYKSIRATVGEDFPVGIKLNSADFMTGGFSEDESLHVIKALDELGIDLIEISGGSYEATVMADGVDVKGMKDSTRQREAYFMAFAERARHLVGTTLVVTGGFRSSRGMSLALAGGATDMIGLARPLAVEPAFPAKAMSDPDYELQLRNLTTGFPSLDKMVLLNMSWYEVQLSRIGKGLLPKKNLNEWLAVWKVFQHMGVYAFRKRRA